MERNSRVFRETLKSTFQHLNFTKRIAIRKTFSNDSAIICANSTMSFNAVARVIVARVKDKGSAISLETLQDARRSRIVGVRDHPFDSE